jgi:hypothetical protein
MRANQALRDRLRYGMGKVDDVNRYRLGAVYGYFAGGNTGSVVATANRITFATSTTAAFTAANLSLARESLIGVSDSVTYGYFAGGFNGTTTLYITADRITFSTGTTAAFTASDLSQARGGLASVSDGNTYGYFAGGFILGGGRVATTDRITFSTGTTAAFTAANLSQIRRAPAGVSDGITYGYFAGGDSGAAVATADRITFSTGTTAAFTAANLSQARERLASVSDGNTYGYFAGGTTAAAGAVVATADRITFSTSTTAAFTAANLSQARERLSGASDGFEFGYFAGGSSGSFVNLATVDRIAFATGTTGALTTANLSQARRGLAGLSDYAI